MNGNPTCLLAGINGGSASSNRRAASRLRAGAAECSGITCVGFAATASTAAPLSTSRRGASGCPKKHAKCRAVKPSFDAGIDGGSIAEAFFNTVETAECGRFENVERLLLARNQFRQVAATTIEGVHEETHTGRVARVGSRGILFQNVPEPVRIARPQKFETTWESFKSTSAYY